ncbi:OmpR Response regulators consisting of a CheY-like receiver domain and a winged-helix DNA-binding domain [Sphingomonadaceae bacterium]
MSVFPANICIVDDDQDFVGFLADYLKLRGSQCSVFWSAEALMQVGGFDQYDFFILDLGLPGIDGVDLTTLIRARSSAGILIVSGRLGPDAFNSALAAGADMFVNKPVRFDQVYHAIQSIWRRFSEPRARSSHWTISDDSAVLVSPLGQEVALTPAEGRLLQRLRTAGGEAVSRADLADAAGIASSPDHRNLDAAVFRLRRKIEREANSPSPFRTVHGVGYQLGEDIDGDLNEPSL